MKLCNSLTAKNSEVLLFVATRIPARARPALTSVKCGLGTEGWAPSSEAALLKEKANSRVSITHETVFKWEVMFWSTMD